MPEVDPTGKEAHEPGAKLDAGKLMGELLILVDGCMFPRVTGDIRVL
jgi:hypothetical protein